VVTAAVVPVVPTAQQWRGPAHETDAS
jgi:hypothetical protein